MRSLALFLFVAHYLGFAMAVGAATSKTVLLLKTRNDLTFVPIFLGASRPLTRLIITGLLLTVASGIAWLGLDYHAMSPRLWAKVMLVALVFAIGPLIDHVIEPRFRVLAPQPGEAPAPAFVAARHRYVAAELLATALLYGVAILWMTR
jgi:hypothetical protein